MSLDFPEEKPTSPVQGEVVQPEQINVPPIFCTQLQLEEVNRQLTATIMAMWKILIDCGIEIKAGDTRPLSQILSLYREDCLKELDNKLAANLQRVAGQNREEQIKYLHRHPEAVLFSGEFARKD